MLNMDHYMAVLKNTPFITQTVENPSYRDPGAGKHQKAGMNCRFLNFSMKAGI